MEVISKKTGRKFTGKVAALMLRIGVAKPIEEPDEFENQDEPSEAERIEKDVIKKTKEAKAVIDKAAELEKVKLIKSGQPAKKPAAKRKSTSVKKANVKRVKK